MNGDYSDGFRAALDGRPLDFISADFDAGWKAGKDSMKRKECDVVQERACTEPVTWTDGVPYCDTCNYYRPSRHHDKDRFGLRHDFVPDSN